MNKKQLAKIKARLKKRLKNSGIMTDSQTLEDIIDIIEGILDENSGDN